MRTLLGRALSLTNLLVLGAGIGPCLGLSACASHTASSGAVSTPAPARMPLKAEAAAHASSGAKAAPPLGAKASARADDAIAAAVKHPALPCQFRVEDDGTSLILDFHASRTNVPRVRDQVRGLSRYFNENRGDPALAQAPDGEAAPDSFAVRKILAARPLARMEDLPDGARLTLTPEDPARKEELRAEILWHTADLLPGLPLAGKTCPELPPEMGARPPVSARR